MQWVSVRVVLLAGLLVVVVAGVSSNPSSLELPTSSAPSPGEAEPFLSHPWDSGSSRRSVGRWLANCRESLAGLPRQNCSSLSLVEVVRLARVSFVPVPPAPDPFESCQSLIRSLEKHGFSVTLEPLCCSRGTSRPQRRSGSSHLDSQENDRP